MRIFLLTTFALTLILSLGSALEPIQEYGVGPRQIIHLLINFLPVTLTFVLPLSALFAATLVYGRLAGENELDACKASGISPIAIIYPGFVLAVIVAMANLLLSFHVMPFFIQRAETSLKADAKQILFRNIQRRGFYRLPGDKYAVYADDANPKIDTLFGVIVIKTGDRQIETIDAAEQAEGSFQSHDQTNEISIMAHNISEIGNNVFRSVKLLQVQGQFGPMLGDQIDFKRIHDMKQIQADPMSFYPTEEYVRQAAKQLTVELLLQDIQGTLQTGGFYELLSTGSDPNAIRIKADQCRLSKSQELQFTQNIEVRIFNRASGKIIKRLNCEKATLTLEDGDEFYPTAAIELRNARTANSTSIIMYDIVRNLALPLPIYRTIARDNIMESLDIERLPSLLQRAPTGALKSMTDHLKVHIRWVTAKIIGTIHSRLVFGIGCIPMIAIGIGIGILKRGGHLLTAFGVSCIPAVLLIIGIICGKHVTENPLATPALGLTIMWSGLGALWLISFIVLSRLYRH